MLVTSDGQPVQGYTADQSGDRRHRHHRPADEHRRPARRAARAVGDDRRSAPPRTSTRTRPSAPHVHGVAADLRLARDRARRDDHLHQHRGRRMELLDRGAGRGCHRRHRRSPPVVLKAGTLTFNSDGLLSQVDGAAAADVAIPAPAAGWKDGATATTMTWDILDANGVANLTGFAAPSQTSSLTQNGAGAGRRQQHQHRRGWPDCRHDWRRPDRRSSASSRSPTSTTRQG